MHECYVSTYHDIVSDFISKIKRLEKSIYCNSFPHINIVEVKLHTSEETAAG